MKIRSLFAFVLAPVAVVGLSFACDDGSVAVDCAVDADCAELTDTPTCDDVLLICVADADVCSEDGDCQLAADDSATGAATCDGNGGCEGDERCVEDTKGVTYCALVLEASDCDATNSLVTLDDIAGDSFTTCLADGTCTDGQCE